MKVIKRILIAIGVIVVLFFVVALFLPASSTSEAESEPKTLHIFFLVFEPENPNLDMLENLKRNRERFKLVDKLFYLHAPDGIGRSKLAARVEKALGVPVTARNWRSVCKIMAMAKQCG